MTKNRSIVQSLIIFIVFLLYSCTSATTSIAPDAILKPVALDVARSQAIDIAYSAAKNAFPGELCERDDAMGIIKVHRHWFWRGDTLMTISLMCNNDDNCLVNVSSEGLGINFPFSDYTTREVEYYLNELNDYYIQFKINRKEKEEMTSKSLSKKLQEIQDAFDNGLISKEEYQFKRKVLLEKY